MNGVEAASRDLFGKSVTKVTLAEGARARRAAEGAVARTRRATTRSARSRAAISCSALMAQQGYLTAGEAAAASRQRRCASPRTSGVPTRGERAARARRGARVRRFGRCPTRCRRATSPSTRRSTSTRSRRPTARCSARPRRSAARRSTPVVASPSLRRARSSRSIRAPATSARSSAAGARSAAASTARSAHGGSRARRSSRSCTPPRSRRDTPATLVDDEPVEVDTGPHASGGRRTTTTSTSARITLTARARCVGERGDGAREPRRSATRA